jgi:DeoR family transcriptional regulator, aga operon transcriptional repressor
MSAAVTTRRTAILEIITDEGFADIARLRRELGGSEATLRRDLEHLERAGHLRRTRGVAALTGGSELPFTMKLGEMAEAKCRIARVAVGLIEDGQAIGFTGGTTTLQVARHLVMRSNLTVVTNALTVAMELARSAVRTIVTGGELRGKTYQLVGPLAEPAASQIHLDLVFVGVDGLSVPGGLTTHNPTEARINRVLVDRSSKVVVVTDHTKLGRKTFAQIAPIDVVDVLITDDGAGQEAIADLEGAGISVLTA